jgi:hypothetical protein
MLCILASAKITLGSHGNKPCRVKISKVVVDYCVKVSSWLTSAFNHVVDVCIPCKQEMEIKQAAKSGNKQVGMRFEVLLT